MTKRCIDCLWYDTGGCVNKEVPREKVPLNKWDFCDKWSPDDQYLAEKDTGMYDNILELKK
jgi:hypothetical protein